MVHETLHLHFVLCLPFCSLSSKLITETNKQQTKTKTGKKGGGQPFLEEIKAKILQDPMKDF